MEKEIMVTLDRKETHKVPISLPYFCKLCRYESGEKFVEVTDYDKEKNKFTGNEINFFDGKFYIFVMGSSFTTNEIVEDALIITKSEYHAAMDKLYDLVNSECGRLLDFEETATSEDDLMLDEERLEIDRAADRADNYNDEQKYKEFERANFAKLTKEP